MTNSESTTIKWPASFSYIRTFQGIDELMLANGLKILLFEDPSLGNVTVNITYLVGSRHEGRGEAGMAHLLEHMLFRGTKDVRDIKAVLQDHGASYNATTWFDRTNYFETLTPTKENLSFALKLEADRMINSLILKEDLDAEMTVVRNEFEMGENNPVHVLHDQMMAAAYRFHPYGRTTIGNRSDIERVPVKALRQFYEHYYQPDNAVLLIAGQFNKKDAVDLIGEYFLPIPRPKRLLDQTYTVEPTQDGPKEVEILRVGDMASVGVAYHIPSFTHPDFAAIKVLFDILADEPAGILYENLVKSKMVSEIFSMSYGLYEPGMALCFTRPIDDNNVYQIKDNLIDLLENKSIDFIDDTHVQRIKTRSLKRFKQALANSKDLALKLSESIACGDWRLFFAHQQQMQNVTLLDVKRVLASYVIKTNRTSGIFKPENSASRALISESPSIASLLESLVEDDSITKGSVFLANVNNIEKHVKREQTSKKSKLAILNKKTRGQSIKAHFRFRFADEDLLTPVIKEFWLIPAMLWRGTKSYNYQGIRDKLDALMSTLDIDGHAGLFLASIKTDKNNFASMIDFLQHILRESIFDPMEFNLVKQREIDNYEEIKHDPQRLGFHELDRMKNPYTKNSIHYVYSYDEIILGLNALSVDRLEEVYYKLFSSAHYYASVVGEIDETSLNNIKYFASDSDTSNYQRIKRPFINNIVERKILHTPDKEMGIIAMAFNFPMRDDHPDYLALKLANYLFGETMNSRLVNRIREKEGISYGAASSIEISRYEDNASLNIYAMASPHSINRAEKAIMEEWQKILDQGFSLQELSLAKESMWLSFNNSLANDVFLANALAHDLEFDRDFFRREQNMLAIKELTSADLNEAMNKWWSNAQFAIVLAYDQR